MYLALFFVVTILFQMFAGGENYTNYQAESVRIAVAGGDGSDLYEGLKQYLGKFHQVTEIEDDISFMQEELFYRNEEYIIRIPENFFEKCVVGDELLPVTKVPGSYTSFYVDQQISTYLNNAKVYYAAGFSEKEIVEALEEMKEAEVELLDFENNTTAVQYKFYFRYVPYLVLSVLCYVLGNILAAFRKGDLPKRMEASAMPLYKQNLAGLLSAFTIGCGLWTVVVAAACVVYHDTFFSDRNIGYYLMNVFVMMLVGLSLSYLVGIFSRNSNSLSGIVNTLTLGMCFLCGVFVPLEVMGKNVKMAAQFLPIYWYERVNDILTEGRIIQGSVYSDVMKAIGIQVVFAAAFVCLALALSKWRQENMK